MPRPKTRSTPTTPTPSNAFLDALRFLSAITKDIGAPYETHIYLNNGYATAFNGVLAAGIKITEDIFAAPNNSLLIQALSKCGQHMSITQLDNNRLSIKSDKFKAVVPCLDPTTFNITSPDAPIALIDDRLKVAFEAVELLANEDAMKVHLASVLLNNGSAIGTNGVMLFEYWHGIDLPPNLALPKAFTKIISKCSKKLTQFGYSQSSCTFYFEDNSWIKTQFYADEWPNIGEILNSPSNPFPVPEGFFKGVQAVAPFSPDGLLHFGKELIQSHPDMNVGASYEVPGLPKGPIFNHKQLSLISAHAEKIDFLAKANNGMQCLMFFGKNIRGAIAGREQVRYHTQIPKRNDMDDNIPF